jgi:hypothetical protein
MLTVGALTVPRFGALGAVVTYLTGRTAEMALLAIEVHRMPAAALPRWRVAVLVGMIMMLAVGAGVAFNGGASQ